MLGFYLIVLALAGLVIGSFLGAYTYRFPKRISVISGRSFCPKCKKKIAWYDNIPLLSFIILGGVCRNCRKIISWRYPLIELTTSLVFLGIGFSLKGQALQGGVELLYALFLSLLFIFIFVVDWEHNVIPDEAVFLGLLVSYCYALFIVHGSLFDKLAAGFLAGDILLFLHLVTRGRGMGLGDVKLAVLGGTLVGLKLVLVWLFLAFLTGGTVGVILILLGRARLKSIIAFGPFLVISLPLTFLWGEKLIRLLLFSSF